MGYLFACATAALTGSHRCLCCGADGRPRWRGAWELCHNAPSQQPGDPPPRPQPLPPVWRQRPAARRRFPHRPMGIWHPCRRWPTGSSALRPPPAGRGRGQRLPDRVQPGGDRRPRGCRRGQRRAARQGQQPHRHRDRAGRRPGVALVRTSGRFNGHVFKLAGFQPDVGADVATIGYPLAGPRSLSRGTVSGLDRAAHVEGTTLTGLNQTDTALNPGNSGGPLLDRDGESSAWSMSRSRARRALGSRSRLRPPVGCSPPGGRPLTLHRPPPRAARTRSDPRT